MDAQFKFFANEKIADGNKPILAGLNYFLTHGARGGEGTRLLGEKRDVKVWLGWLERLTHGDVSAIDTPIGLLPKYDDLKRLFRELIDKEYTEDLYSMQFALYVDNIVGRIDMQSEAYRKEKRVPEKFFDILARQRAGLMELKEKYGSVVTPDHLG
jgi:phosphoenolpyruvate carboxykinase (GTP)